MNNNCSHLLFSCICDKTRERADKKAPLNTRRTSSTSRHTSIQVERTSDIYRITPSTKYKFREWQQVSYYTDLLSLCHKVPSTLMKLYLKL